MDRVTGEWSLVFEPWLKFDVTYGMILGSNMFWFYMAFILWVILGSAVLAYIRVKKDMNTGKIDCLARLNLKVKMPELMEYLRMKGVASEEVVADRASPVMVVSFFYVDTDSRLWAGYHPEITLKVDVKNALLRDAQIHITKPASRQARIFPRDLQQRMINELEDQALLVTDEGAKAAIDASAAGIVLIGFQPGADYIREVRIEARTIDHLKEQVALKFCYKVENIITMRTLKTIEGQEVEEVLESDDQVGMLRPMQKVEVSFKGRPDPGMSIFAQQLKGMQKAMAPGQKLNLSTIKKLSTNKKKNDDDF